MTSELRERLLYCLDHQLGDESRAAAHEFLTVGTDAGRWRFVSRLVQKLPAGALGLKPMRVALLASFSIEFVQDALMALGWANGLQLTIQQAGFAQYHQEMIQPTSRLYSFKPDVVILAIEGQRVMPSVYETVSLTGQTDKNQVVTEAMAQIEPLITALRQHSDALLLIHNFDPPSHPPLGILDGMIAPGQTEVIQAVNAALLDLARHHRSLFVVDYAKLVARAGMENWYDLRMAYLAKAPIAQNMLPRLATEYLKFLRAAAGMSRKCLVVDLDNTLWGGVLGEEGVSGIQLGPEYPGSAFLALQRALLQLHDRGVLLAMASKNNVADVEEVFRLHPHMLLRLDHFACREIHWNPKTTSLVSIAQRLNIGLEHMVFMDDNPVECEQVKTGLPMVSVILFPSRPEEAIRALYREGLFDTLNFSSEDGKRGQLYQQRANAEALLAASGSLTEFYWSLGMRVDLSRATPATLSRTAQLTQKTNQFNLTTYRYTEEEVARRMADPDWLVMTVQVTDRFGDNGIVGVMMAKRLARENKLDVDTFLLSCRVIGRTVETAMLACLCEQARDMGLNGILGRVIPSAKNAPSQMMYQNHGFTKQSDTSSAATEAQTSLWELDLTRGEVTMPPWITLIKRPAI
ncbi:MAG: HAD-IIIC family phosphatase [Magnetococcus sp. YQC-5]